MPSPLRDLVDVERGIISREIFVSDEIYQQEQAQVFSRAWLFIGHESQIPRPGDFLTSSMGEESVILGRDRESRIHVFLNSCRHRGMKVCRYDEGNTVEFMCPYHGWSYATDGALVGVPHAKDAYGAQLDKSRWGLVDADAPPQVKDFLRHYYIRYSGPSGLTEQDDMENWNYAHKASRGTIARQYPYNYEMGLGRATRDFEDHGLRLPGSIAVVTDAASENNQRGFYTRYRQFMEAPSWAELK